MWYVIWTETGKEEVIKLEIEAMIPKECYSKIQILTRDVKKRYRGIWRMQKEKLFPGYIFIETDETDELAAALRLSTRYAKVLGTGKMIAPIMPAEEQFIRKLTADTTNVEFSVGDIVGKKVIVREGPLCGMEGLIKYIDRHKRMAVLEVELFNRITEVKVGLEIVEKNEYIEK